ncbi:MAG: glycosyltransferase family 4 protein, partial [Candidatus Zixiibacteriota bacterium]
ATKTVYEQMLGDVGAYDRDGVQIERLSFDDLAVTSAVLRWCSRLGMGGFLTNVVFIRNLVRRLSGINILHVVHPAHMSGRSWPVVLVMVGRFFGRKVILDYSGPLVLSRLAGKSALVQKIWRLCDLILVPSKYQEQLINMLGGRAYYRHPPVLPSKIASRVIDRVQPRLLVVSDLEREHNVACAVRAFKLVKQKYPRTELIIVGSGQQRGALEDLVGRERTAGVSFTGELSEENRRRQFENSDIFINCSMVDYLSGATLEALAYGLPVLTTPLGGGLGLFRDRDNIVQLSYSNSVALAERIIELVEDPRLVERLSRRSRETALALERDTVGQGRLEPYRKVLGS